MTCWNPCCREHARLIFCPSCWLMAAIAKVVEVAIVAAVARWLMP